VRDAAAAALSQFRHWEASPEVQPVLPKVKDALEHADYWVRNSAQKLFEQMKLDPEQLPGTSGGAPAPADDSHPAFQTLADLLFDQDRDLRLVAVEAFRHLHERNALPLLSGMIQDSDRNVQLAARRALTAME